MPLTGPTAIQGVWATILCRLDDDNAPDLAAIDEQVAAYARAGCDGVYSGGTASEIHTQTDIQFREISARFAATARKHGLPFQLGAAHPLAHGTLGRVSFARTLDPGAIQVTLPDWTPLDLAGVVQFMDRVSEAADGTPLVLYNPPHAKTVLAPSDLVEIARALPTLVGIKCGGGDRGWYREMAPLLEQISVFIPGHHYATGRKLGAHGSYSNMACLSPAGAVTWARMSGREALELEGRIASFMADAISPMLNRGLPGFACDKAMAAAGRWTEISPRLMWPYIGATNTDVTQIRFAARRHLPEFLKAVHA